MNSSASLSLDILPDGVRSLAIGHLHLPLRLYNKLMSAEITTLGNLCDELISGFKQVSGINQNIVRDITSILTAIADAITQDGTVDWIKYCETRGIQLLPKHYKAGLSHKQVLQELPEVIKEVLCHELSDRDWQIIERRFALSGKQKLTLEELGMAFGGLTRERVRQIEKRALTVISHVFIEYQYSGKNYRVYPDVARPVKHMFDALATNTKELVLETELFGLVGDTFDIDPESVKPILVLLFDVAGMSRIEFDNLSLVPVWQRTETGQRDVLENVLKHLDNLLTRETARPMDELDILVNINKKMKKTKKLNPLQLRRFIGLCSSIECCGENLWQGKFEHLKGRGNQVERIFLEINKPATIAAIAREINSRLVPLGHRKLESRNLVNQLASDERFVAIGRSGEWGLASWQLDTDSIIELMERCLIEGNQPASADEIYEYVNSRRPVSVNSIKLYLISKTDIFGQVDRTRWGLVSWKEVRDAKTWSPEEVADFVADIFRKRRATKLEYRILSEALASAADVSIRRAQGMLNYNPVIQTQRTAQATTYAIFQPDYKEQLAKRNAGFVATGQVTKKNQKHEVQEVARHLLVTSPQKQMLLSELATSIVKQSGIPKSAVYRYLSEAEFIEKVDVSGSNAKMCRLRQGSSLSFPQLNNLPEGHIAAEARRAFSKLTVDEVDIGLFLLGRLFEGVLKDYVLTVEQMSTYNVTPPGDKKLANLVAWIKKEGIVVDSTVLQVLREERNERAHGQVPPMEERQRILDGVEWVVNRYLDHILLFTRKREELLKQTQIPGAHL